MPLLLVVVLVIAAILTLRYLNARDRSVATYQARSTRCSQIDRAYAGHVSGQWLMLSATVSKILPDQYGAFTHQRFLVRCSSGRTVLVVNDVSIGTRAPVHVGDAVSVRGQYVWNRLGGLVHFTHHSSSGSGGWILEAGKLYSARLRQIVALKAA